MEPVQDVRGQGCERDSMTDDDKIRGYVRDVRSELQLPRSEKRRVAEELANHLDDSADRHMRSGHTRKEAVDVAIAELGDPSDVASEFNDETSRGSHVKGIPKWLPLALPTFQLLLGGILLAWSLIGDLAGSTRGNRTIQGQYLLLVIAAAILSYGVFSSVRHAEKDSSWRWVAWFCSVLAILPGLLPFIG